MSLQYLLPVLKANECSAVAGNDNTIRLYEGRNEDEKSGSKRSYPLSFDNDGTSDCEFVEIGMMNHENPVWCVSISPNGNFIASASNRSVFLWERKTMKMKGCAPNSLNLLFEFKHEEWVNSLCFHPTNNFLVTGSSDNNVRILDICKKVVVRVLEGHLSPVCSVFCSYDGLHVLSGSLDKSVYVWDFETGKEIFILEKHTGWVRSVCCTHNNTYVLSASNDTKLIQWELKTGKYVKEFIGHTKGVICVCVSWNDDLVFSGSHDDTIRMWKLNSGNCLNVLKGHTNSIYSISLSPDNKTIISGSADHTICVWNVGATTAKCVQILKAHSSLVYSVCYSPDGESFVSGSRDHSVLSWTKITGSPTNTLRCFSSPASCLGLSLDGSLMVAVIHDPSTINKIKDYCSYQ